MSSRVINFNWILEGDLNAVVFLELTMTYRIVNENTLQIVDIELANASCESIALSRRGRPLPGLVHGDVCARWASEFVTSYGLCDLLREEVEETLISIPDLTSNES